MGADAIGLIAEWELAVAACASAGSAQFGYRNADGKDLLVRPLHVRRLVEARFAGTACAFYWDEAGGLRVRALGKHVLERDERGEIWAKPRKSGRPVDVKLSGIPGVDIRHMPGPGVRLIEAGCYYQRFRESLPEAIRQPTDALARLLYPASVGAPDDQDDLGIDSCVSLVASPAVYALRPATVHDAVRRAADVPWAALRGIAGRTEAELHDYETFEITMMCQMRWLAEANGRSCGVIALVFQ